MCSAVGYSLTGGNCLLFTRVLPLLLRLSLPQMDIRTDHSNNSVLSFVNAFVVVSVAVVWLP
jgi:hypothetical protein